MVTREATRRQVIDRVRKGFETPIDLTIEAVREARGRGYRVGGL